jgi:hypothetical protein
MILTWKKSIRIELINMESEDKRVIVGNDIYYVVKAHKCLSLCLHCLGCSDRKRALG